MNSWLLQWNSNLKARVTWFRFDFDRAMVFLHDAHCRVEAESGTLADRLGREEWIEDARLDVVGNAGPAVANLDAHRIQSALGDDPQFALTAHSVNRIVNQVGPNLVEFASVGANLRQFA